MKIKEVNSIPKQKLNSTLVLAKDLGLRPITIKVHCQPRDFLQGDSLRSTGLDKFAYTNEKNQYRN